jgi:hypothetical protein
MTAEEWIERFASAAGTTPPSAGEVAKLLDLAGEAAHSSERIAAPIACWIAGRRGLDIDEALALAGEIGDASD